MTSPCSTAWRGPSSSPARRCVEPDAVAANRLGQPGLWPHAISGDRPIVLVRVAAADDGSLVRQVVQWHAYARRRGLDPDLVILDAGPGGADRLRADLQAGPAGALLGKPGGVFVLDAGKVSADDAVLLTAAARAVLGRGPPLPGRSARRPTGRAGPPAAVGDHPADRPGTPRESRHASRGPSVLERLGWVHGRRS